MIGGTRAIDSDPLSRRDCRVAELQVELCRCRWAEVWGTLSNDGGSQKTGRCGNGGVATHCCSRLYIVCVNFHNVFLHYKASYIRYFFQVLLGRSAASIIDYINITPCVHSSSLGLPEKFFGRNVHM